MADKDNLYFKLRTGQVVRAAWDAIRANGIRSGSLKTRDQIDKFSKESHRHIDRIQRQLRSGKYRFKDAEGVPIRQKGKKARPIVLAPIEDRIVQRALLDVMKKYEPLQHLFNSPTSFGTSDKRSVEAAIAEVRRHIRGDFKYIVRSDIKAFFTKVPRISILEQLRPLVNDEDFFAVLERATKVELSNAELLGADLKLFPDYDTGVAQGCSLSPVLGNVFLSDFDRQMNARGIVCLRYVDDFLLIGSSEAQVRAAFRSAEKWLNNHGLEVHGLDSDKTHVGRADGGFDFLGCGIRPGLTAPSRDARARLRARIQEILARGQESLANGCKNRKGEIARATVARTMFDLGNVVRAWGKAFAFCNDRETMRNLDAQIGELIGPYVRHAAAKMTRGTTEEARSLAGIPELASLLSPTDGIPAGLCECLVAH